MYQVKLNTHTYASGWRGLDRDRCLSLASCQKLDLSFSDIPVRL